MRNRPNSRGFTLIEMLVVVAIIGALAALAIIGVDRWRPRATLESTAAELQSLVHLARQTALASGQDVAVMVFPDHVTQIGTGRVVVYRDSTFDLFLGASGGLTFDTYDPEALAVSGTSEVVATLDLPKGVLFGPAGGGGVVLTPPFDTIPTATACPFCDAAGDHRGAIRFDPRGTATFFDSDGPVLVTSGASLSLEHAELGAVITLVVTTPAGAVVSYKIG